MSKVYLPLDFGQVRTVPLARRANKVSLDHLAGAPQPEASFRQFWNRLPDVLGARSLRAVVAAIVRARRCDRPVIWAMGAHVVKCGLSPVVIDLMERGVVTAVAMNGAAAIHDCEMALVGQTSEDVARGLADGTFGMAEETGRLMNEAVAAAGGDADGDGPGMGLLLGKRLLTERAPNAERSILARALEMGVPATVHVAIGTDIIHMHPGASGKALGAASFRDFRLLASVVADLGGGGVHLNVGSAVLLPEVFLKALTVARNLGYEVSDFTTVNMDMQSSYRAMENVVRRPVDGHGQGYTLIGHHEIMVPLLAQAVLEEMSGER